MLKKILIPMIAGSFILNIVFFVNGCDPTAQNEKCGSNPISECNDPGRFHSRHVKGKAWEATEQMKRDYALRYAQAPAGYRPGVFISKKVLNEVFRSDNSANGIVCTFGLDPSDHFGILIQPGQSDSTDLGNAPMASLKNEPEKYLLAQVSSSDTSTATTKIYFSRIYCPPQCVRCDTCQTVQR